MDTGLRNKENESVFFKNKFFKNELLIQFKEDFFKFMQIILDDWEQKKQIPVTDFQLITEEHVIKIINLTENSREYYLDSLKENRYREMSTFLKVYLSPKNNVVKSEGTRYNFLAVCFRVNELYKGKETNADIKLSPLYFYQITRFFISSFLKDKKLQPPKLPKIKINSQINILSAPKIDLMYWQSGRQGDNSNCVSSIKSNLEIFISQKTANLLNIVTEKIREEFLELNVIMTDMVAQKYRTLENLLHSKNEKMFFVSLLNLDEENAVNNNYHKYSLVPIKEGKGEKATFVAFAIDTLNFIFDHPNKEHERLSNENGKYKEIAGVLIKDTIRRLWTQPEENKFTIYYQIPHQIDKYHDENRKKDPNAKNAVAATCAVYAVANALSKLWNANTYHHISEIYEEIKKEVDRF